MLNNRFKITILTIGLIATMIILIIVAIIIDPYLKVGRILQNINIPYHVTYDITATYNKSSYSSNGSIDMDLSKKIFKGSGYAGLSYIKTQFDLIGNDTDIFFHSRILNKWIKLKIIDSSTSNLQYDSRYIGKVNDLYHYKLNVYPSFTFNFNTMSVDIFVGNEGYLKNMVIEVSKLNIQDIKVDLSLKTTFTKTNTFTVTPPSSFENFDPKLLKGLKDL